MSLFDSLKYPISDPPTVEQLAAVPWLILAVWCQAKRCGDWNGHSDLNVLYRTLAIVYSSEGSITEAEKLQKKQELDLLRKLILAYEPV